MGYTKYGEFMRILRIKAHEVMGDTAKLLNVRVPFVSAVESGKRNVPSDWVPVLIEHYHLNASEQAELRDAIEESRTQMKIDLTAASSAQRRLAMQFQRSFDELDDETAEEIMKLLSQEDE